MYYHRVPWLLLKLWRLKSVTTSALSFTPMGKEDYASAGGALKLKGTTSGSITKKKKRRIKKVNEDAEHVDMSNTDTIQSAHKASPGDRTNAIGIDTLHQERDDQEANASISLTLDSLVGKTESERKFEEMRRKRVCSHNVNPFWFQSNSHISSINDWQKKVPKPTKNEWKNSTNISQI